MYRIAIIGSESCQKTRQVKELLFKIKETFGNTATIISGGNGVGIEKTVKKTTLEFGMKYVEFNPSFTGYNLYSALPPNYYTKAKHNSHFFHRYTEMLKFTDKLFIGYDEDSPDVKLYDSVIKKAKKMNIDAILF